MSKEWAKGEKSELRVSQGWAKSEPSQPIEPSEPWVSQELAEWAKWVNGEPRVSQGRARSESRMSQEWAEWGKGEPRESQEWAMSEPSQSSQPSQPIEPCALIEPWVSQEWTKSEPNVSQEWVEGEPRMSQGWAKNEPRVSQLNQVSQVSREWAKWANLSDQNILLFAVLLFAANLTDVGILRYVCLLFPDGKKISGISPPSIGLLLATPLKVFKHSDISETRKKSLYGVKIPTACSWNTKYACRSPAHYGHHRKQRIQSVSQPAEMLMSLQQETHKGTNPPSKGCVFNSTVLFLRQTIYADDFCLVSP